MKILKENIEFRYINLDSREDRKEHIEHQLKAVGISAKRFKGVEDVSQLNICWSSNITEGQKKCYVSHKNLLEEYKDVSNGILGIFEDDVVFCEDFLQRFEYIEENFNMEWDIFYLSSFYHLNDDRQRWNESGDFSFTNVDHIHRVFGSFCTHSYLVNTNSIKKILSLLDETVSKSIAIDHSYILIQPRLNCFSFTPGMTTQITNYSDVTNESRDQTVFENIVGKHYFANNIKDLDYYEYFKKYK
jgi:GR25 family glycosyltransferase involved in LPS biosynthesis